MQMTRSLWAKSDGQGDAGLDRIVIRDLTPAEAESARKKADEAVQTSKFVEYRFK